MDKNKIIVFDTTLRDGEQSPGCSMNTEEKIKVALQLEKLGVGEIVINSIDHDGQMKGYDFDLISKIREVIHIPMTVLGGAGSMEDIGRLIERFGIIGASVSLVAMVVVSLLTKPESAAVQQMIDDLRIPSGKTIIRHS